jgi:hypothetical protein
VLNKFSKRSEVSEMPSHRELIAYVEARVQNLQFMTFKDLDKMSYCPQNHFGSNRSKYVKRLRIRLDSSTVYVLQICIKLMCYLIPFTIF